MNHNINVGYGQLIADRLQGNNAGKTIVVGASALAHIDIYKNIFQPDADGKVLFAATVDAAVGLCTAASGDTIYVLPGHTETITNTSTTLDVAGINIVCLGHGANAPIFTYSAAEATITVSAANVTWKGGRFVGNFDNVAAAFTLGDCANFKLEGGDFIDNSSVLHFMSIVVTGATNNACDGLQVIRNRWWGLALAPNAFISILGDADRVVIADNDVTMAATNDVGHFLTITGDTLRHVRIVRNSLFVTGATNASVGIFLTGSSTDNTGIVAYNLVTSLDTTSELIATAGTGLAFFENYYTGTADASGKLWPAVDAA
jgi:hypothetical protein